MSVEMFRDERAPLDDIARASEFGLVIPTIHVLDKVDIRLSRIDRTLDVNTVSLVEGAKELEIETPIATRIDDLPKHVDEREPRLDFFPENWNSTDGTRVFGLRADTKPSVEKKSEEKLNIAYWLGVIVSNELADGQEIVYEQNRKATRRKIGIGGLAVTVGVNISDNIASLLTSGDYVTGGAIDVASLFAAIGVQAGIITYTSAKYGEDKNTTTDLIMRSKRSEAEAIAKRFPVLQYNGSVVTNW